MIMRKANNSRHIRRAAAENAYCCAASLVAVLVVALIFSRCWSAMLGVLTAAGTGDDGPCDEFYVVGEGETLQSIMDKCEDPFIVENNPQIHESDELFPGLVIRVIPFNHG